MASTVSVGPIGSRPAPGGPLASVQILRALAALTVVFGHAQQMALSSAHDNGLGVPRLSLLPWGAGVDLFFVISGFIMVYASETLFAQADAPRRFLTRRLVRIVPPYWAVLTLYVVLHGYLGAAAHAGNVRPLGVLASYFFWPFDGFQDGVPRPVYTLGWTLNYEMFFYAIFATSVGLSRVAAVTRTATFLVALVALGAVVAPGAAPLKFWTQPIILEFALGMGLALALRRGVTLPDWGRLALAFVAVGILFADPMNSASQGEGWIAPNGWLRVAGWGLPALAIMAAATLGANVWRPAGRLWAFAVLSGDASYALYLTHPLIVTAMQKTAHFAAGAGAAGVWALMAAEVAVCLACAIALHLWSERPATRFLSGLAQTRFVAPATKTA